jgi:uncharacterized damage-inducible protein DinB
LDQDRTLRTHLRKLLDWEDAHAALDAAVADVPPALRGVVPPGLPHSLWQLLEHLRLCQRDILDFCRNARYVEPESLDEYWPKTASPPTEAAWEESIAACRRDREAMKALAADTSLDLFARIPHGSGQTCLRELLLVADHNAYHVGQMVLVRRLLGIWKR